MRRTSRRSQIGVALLMGYTLLSLSYAPIWTNELTLWTWAVDRAPMRPRPHVNLALAFMERRRFTEARSELDTAQALAEQIAMPEHNRRSTLTAVSQNRAALARLTEQP